MKKEQIYISHVLFPWETFEKQGQREKRERKNGGIRWTKEFKREVRENIVRYANMEDQAIRNSSLNEVYRLVPIHFRSELFEGVSFPIWEGR